MSNRLTSKKKRKYCIYPNLAFGLNGLNLSLSRPNKPSLLPPLYEGEALACRVLDVSPSGVKFLQPVYLELPHFSALRDGERELVVLRTQDGGWNWQEVCVEDMKGERIGDSAVWFNNNLNNLYFKRVTPITMKYSP